MFKLFLNCMNSQVIIGESSNYDQKVSNCYHQFFDAILFIVPKKVYNFLCLHFRLAQQTV